MGRLLSAETPGSLVWLLPVTVAGVALRHGDYFILLFGWMAAVPVAFAVRRFLARRFVAAAACAGFFTAIMVLFVDVFLTPSSTQTLISGGVLVVSNGELTTEGYLKYARLAAYYSGLAALGIAIYPVFERAPK